MGNEILINESFATLWNSDIKSTIGPQYRHLNQLYRPTVSLMYVVGEKMMNIFTIKDLENLSGIKAHTIRMWEQRYGFLKPNRTETNIRYYDCGQLKKLLNIALLNKYGFRISQITRMDEDEIYAQILSLNALPARLERCITDLINAMIDLNIDVFEEVTDRYIAEKGIEKALIQVIFPFLEKVGLLWCTNHINPAQEHLVTNIIRQKIIIGIENAFSKVLRDYTVVLFLPEGEFHELGLLYVNYLMKMRGISTLYMGANVPLGDVLFLNEQKKVDSLYIHLTTLPKNFQFDYFLKEISKIIKQKPVTISGVPVQHYHQSLPANIHIKRSLPETISFINAL